MKKMVTIMGLALTVMVSASCSNDTTEESLYEETERENPRNESRPSDFQALRDSIDKLHAQIPIGLNPASATRASSNLLWRKFEGIVGIDAYSTMTLFKRNPYHSHSVPYSVIGGSYCSLLAATNMGLDTGDDNNGGGLLKTLSLDSLVFTSGTPSVTDSVGYYHNKIITDIIGATMPPYIISDAATDAYIGYVCQVYAIGQLLPVDDFKKNFGNSFFYKIICQYREFMATDPYLSGFIEYTGNQLQPDDEQLMEILGGYVSMIVQMNSWPAAYSYTAAVIKEIMNSSVSSADKRALKAGITVAYASYRLWKDRT